MMQGFRSATGVLVLSTALLIGSSAGSIAAAETGTGDSASGSSTSSAENSTSSSSGDSQEDNSTPSSATDVDTADAGAAEEAAADASAAEDAAAEDAAADASAAEDAAAEDAAAEDAAAEDAAAEDDGLSVVAIGDASVNSQPAGDQSIPESSSTAAESQVAESEALGPLVSASSSSEVGAVASASNTVASNTVASTASNSPTPPAAATATPSSSTSQGEPAGGLELTPGTQPPPLADVLAAMTTGMVSLGDSMTTVVVSLGNTVATVVISLGNAAAAIPPAIWALPFSPTPISDVIALVETVLASVAESATAVLQFPSDVVAAFSSGTIGTGPILISEPSSNHRVDVVPAISTLVGESPVVGSSLLPALTPQQPVDVIDRVSGFAAFTPTAFAAAFSAPLKTVPAFLPAGAGEYDSIFDRAFGAILVPLSLWALATGALPGLLGLLVVFGAGARVGYRQAKAGFALKMVGIARFAGPGPLGVVRSGSLVELHQRGVGVAGHRAPHWCRLGDQAA